MYPSSFTFSPELVFSSLFPYFPQLFVTTQVNDKHATVQHLAGAQALWPPHNIWLSSDCSNLLPQPFISLQTITTKLKKTTNQNTAQNSENTPLYLWVLLQCSVHQLDENWMIPTGITENTTPASAPKSNSSNSELSSCLIFYEFNFPQELQAYYNWEVRGVLEPRGNISSLSTPILEVL